MCVIIIRDDGSEQRLEREMMLTLARTTSLQCTCVGCGVVGGGVA